MKLLKRLAILAVSFGIGFWVAFRLDGSFVRELPITATMIRECRIVPCGLRGDYIYYASARVPKNVYESIASRERMKREEGLTTSRMAQGVGPSENVPKWWGALTTTNSDVYVKWNGGDSYDWMTYEDGILYYYSFDH